MARLRGRIDKGDLQIGVAGRGEPLGERVRRIGRGSHDHAAVAGFDARIRGPFGVAPPMSGEVGFEYQHGVFCHAPTVAKNMAPGRRGADIGYEMAVPA